MGSTQIDRIDGVFADLAIKAPCRVISDVPVPFTGSAPFGFLTVAGVVVSDNAGTGAAPDRVLLNGQTDLTQNGIWEVAAGAWRRALDFDGARDAANGTIVTVYSPDGLIAMYQLQTANPVLFGTSEIVFTGIATLPPDGTFGLTDRTMDANTASPVVVVTDHAGHIFVDGAAGSFAITFLPSTQPGMWVTFVRSDSSPNGNTVTINGQSGVPRATLNGDGDWATLQSHNNGAALKLIASGRPL